MRDYVLCTANYKNTTLFWNIFKNATPIFQKYHTWEITPGSWAHQSQDRLSGLRLRVEDPVTAPVAATGVRLPR